MTLVKDTRDEWLEDALTYVRDQLRENTLLGLNASAWGVKRIEVGEVSISELAQHPENLPGIWITPRSIATRRSGNVLDHRVSLELQAFATGPLEPHSEFMDAQARFRRLSGVLWNEALHLRDAGATAGHWDDWEPDGASTWDAVGLESGALMAGTVKMAFSLNRIWISEGS